MASTKSPGGVEVGRVSIKVVPDTSKFREELIAQLKAAGRGLEVEIPVRIDTQRAMTHLRALQARINILNRMMVNGSFGSNNNTLPDFSRNLQEVSRNAFRAGNSLFGMSRMALIVTAVLALAAPVLGLVATLLAGLPSLILAAGVAFATIALGMDGIKDAAKTLAPEVENLRNSLSATFREGLAPVFDELRAVFPVLERGLNRVALGLIDVARELTTFITSGPGLRQLEFILNGIGQFFTDMAPVIRDFVAIFLDLAATGVSNFGILVNMLAEFAQSFQDMLNNLDAEVFTNAFQGLAEVLGAVLRLFTDLFGIGLKVMGDLGEPLAILINGINGLLQGMLPILSLLSGVVARVLGEAFMILGQILRALEPSLTLIVNLLGNVLMTALRILGPILVNIAEILNKFLLEAFTKLEPVIVRLLDFLGQYATLLGETLVSALEILMPFLLSLVQFAVDFFTVIQPLLPLLLELAEKVMKMWLDILIQIMPHLMQIAQDVLPVFLQAVIDLMPSLMELVQTFISAIGPITEFAKLFIDFVGPAVLNLLKIVSDAWPAIKEIIQGAIQLISGIIKTFLGIITGDWDLAWEGLKQQAEGILNILKGIVDVGLRAIINLFFGLPGAIIGAMGDVGSKLFESGRSLVRGFIDGIKNMIGSAANAARDLVSKVRSFFPFSPAKEGPFSGQGYTFFSGQALVQDWAAGIRAAEPQAVSAIDDMMASSQNALDLNAQVQTEGFGGLGEVVSSALSGWTVEIDANGIARLVNKVNRSNERR